MRIKSRPYHSTSCVNFFYLLRIMGGGGAQSAFTDYFPSPTRLPKKEATAGSRRSGLGLVTESTRAGGATRSKTGRRCKGKRGVRDAREEGAKQGGTRGLIQPPHLRMRGRNRSGPRDARSLRKLVVTCAEQLRRGQGRRSSS